MPQLRSKAKPKVKRKTQRKSRKVKKPMQKTVLIVDDEPDLRELLVRAFRERGFRTLEATNGALALKVILKEKPDAVVSDLYMHGGGGIDLLNKAKEHDPELPFFLISGADVLLPAESDGHKADFHFTKPFLPSRLADTVALSVKASAKRNQ